MQRAMERCGPKHSLEIVGLLIEAGVPVKGTESVFEAARKSYAHAEDLELLGILFEAGADVFARKESGDTLQPTSAIATSPRF